MDWMSRKASQPQKYRCKGLLAIGSVCSCDSWKRLILLHAPKLWNGSRQDFTRGRSSTLFGCHSNDMTRLRQQRWHGSSLLKAKGWGGLTSERTLVFRSCDTWEVYMAWMGFCSSIWEAFDLRKKQDKTVDAHKTEFCKASQAWCGHIRRNSVKSLVASIDDDDPTKAAWCASAWTACFECGCQGWSLVAGAGSAWKNDRQRGTLCPLQREWGHICLREGGVGRILCNCCKGWEILTSNPLWKASTRSPAVVKKPQSGWIPTAGQAGSVLCNASRKHLPSPWEPALFRTTLRWPPWARHCIGTTAFRCCQCCVALGRIRALQMTSALTRWPLRVKKSFAGRLRWKLWNLVPGRALRLTWSESTRWSVHAAPMASGKWALRCWWIYMVQALWLHRFLLQLLPVLVKRRTCGSAPCSCWELRSLRSCPVQSCMELLWMRWKSRAFGNERSTSLLWSFFTMDAMDPPRNWRGSWTQLQYLLLCQPAKTVGGGPYP